MVGGGGGGGGGPREEDGPGTLLGTRLIANCSSLPPQSCKYEDDDNDNATPKCVRCVRHAHATSRETGLRRQRRLKAEREGEKKKNLLLHL